MEVELEMEAEELSGDGSHQLPATPPTRCRRLTLSPGLYFCCFFHHDNDDGENGGDDGITDDNDEVKMHCDDDEQQENTCTSLPAAP